MGGYQQYLVWLPKKVVVDITVSQFSFTSFGLFVVCSETQYIKTVSGFMGSGVLEKRVLIIEK